MSRNVAIWTLVGVLATSLAVRLLPPRVAGSGFATLPIFVPASLGYETQMRSERQQPAERGHRDVAALAWSVLRQPTTPDTRATVEALRDARLHLLDLRNRRHALNVRIMDVGVAVARELDPEQWEVITGQRDALKARAEAASFQRVLDSLPPQ